MSAQVDELHHLTNDLVKALGETHKNHEEYALLIAHDLMEKTRRVAIICNELEEVIPNKLYSLPKYYDMLFLK